MPGVWQKTRHNSGPLTTIRQEHIDEYLTRCKDEKRRPSSLLGCAVKPEHVEENIKAFPGSTVCIALGASGFTSFDLDIKIKDEKLIDGVAMFLALCRDNGLDLTRYPVILTPSGGRHIIIPNPKNYASKQFGRIGVDVKAFTGQIVAPGSIREDGGRYVEIPGHPTLLEACRNGLPEAPKWMWNWVRANPGKSSGNSSGGGSISTVDKDARRELARLQLLAPAPERPQGYVLAAAERLVALNEKFSTLWQNGTGDCSNDRLAMIGHMAPFLTIAGYTVHDHRDLMGQWMFAGAYVETKHESGDYDDRQLYREYGFAVDLSPKHASFGPADDDAPVDPLAPAKKPTAAELDDDGLPVPPCWLDMEVEAVLMAGCLGDDQTPYLAALKARLDPKLDRISLHVIETADWSSETGIRQLRKTLAREEKRKRLVQAEQTAERSELRINPVRIHAASMLITKTLLKRKADLFNRGGQIVEVAEADVPTGLQKEDTQRAIILQPTTRSGFAASVSEHLKLMVGPDDKLKEIAPPRTVTDTVFDNAFRYPLRAIERVSEGPMLMADGTIISTKGYDARTKTFITRKMTLPPIPDAPTRDEALKALAKLDSLLDGFEFDNAMSRSAALSAMLTTPTRNLYNVVPATLFSAPMAGSGKTFLYTLVSQIAIGRTGALLAAGRTETETEKRLDAMLLFGVSVLCIDNVNGVIGGDKLCQIVERPQVEIRELGYTKRQEFVNVTSTFMTGNNATLTTDMVRRTLIVRMEPKTDSPEQRKFGFNPVDRVVQDRPAYLAAVFTVIKAWMVAQKSAPTPNRAPLGSFEMWDDMVRGALIWLGREDPVSTQALGREMDTTRNAAATIFPSWRAAFGEKFVTAAEAAEAIEAADMAVDGEKAELKTLGAVLRAQMVSERKGSSTSFARRLSYLLRELSARVFDGLRLENRSRSNVQNWRVTRL